MRTYIFLLSLTTYHLSLLTSAFQDVLSLRKRSGVVRGSVFLNGWPQESSAFRRCSGYVEQFDVQSPELTVYETILFSAKLRLDRTIASDPAERKAFVDQVLVSECLRCVP